MSEAPGTGAGLAVDDLNLKKTGELEKGFNLGNASGKIGLLGVQLSGRVWLVCTGAGFDPQQYKFKRMYQRMGQGEF